MSIEIIKTDSELITVLKLKISARLPFYRVDRDPGDPTIHPDHFSGRKSGKFARKTRNFLVDVKNLLSKARISLSG